MNYTVFAGSSRKASQYLPFLVFGENSAIYYVEEYRYFGVYLVDILSAWCGTSGILKRELVVRYLNHRYLIINNCCSIIKLKTLLGYIAETTERPGVSKGVSFRTSAVRFEWS